LGTARKLDLESPAQAGQHQNSFKISEIAANTKPWAVAEWNERGAIYFTTKESIWVKIIWLLPDSWMPMQ
jgi:hypothetical protein